MRLILTLLMSVMLGSADATFDVRQFNTPEDEARYKALIEELRCTVCQNQNIADSNAELAADLRRKTYELVQQGMSNREITNFMVERYGNFVLYRPPLSAGTLILWAGPFLALAFGGFLLLRVISRRRARADDGSAAADKVKLRRAQDLLRQDGDNS